MKRLTIMTPKGAALKMDDTYPDEDAARSDLMSRYRAAVDRLAAYEDTGLEPEEIAEVQACMEPIPFGRFRDIMEAERNGMLSILPPNAPLTLEELQGMDGEPVWIRNHCTDAYTCRVIKSSDAHFTYFTDGGLCENRGYGSYWTAYRRKPEEGFF